MVETGCPNRCGNNQCGRASPVNLEGGSVNGGVASTNREANPELNRAAILIGNEPDGLPTVGLSR